MYIHYENDFSFQELVQKWVIWFSRIDNITNQKWIGKLNSILYKQKSAVSHTMLVYSLQFSK